MFSQKELTKIQRRKRSIVAHSDLLRGECGQLWSSVGRRVEAVEDARIGRLRWLQPVISVAVTNGFFLLKEGGGSRKGKLLGALFSLVNLAADLSHRSPDGEGRHSLWQGSENGK